MTMRHDGGSCQRVMESDTSEKRIFHYVQQELPNRYFAVVRMEWRDNDGEILQVDEVKLIDEYGRTMDLNGTDFAFTLSLTTIYSQTS